MGDRHLKFLLYWGGEIITGPQGLTYNMKYKKGFKFREGSTYEQLVDKIYSVMGIDGTSSSLKITCRCPQFVGLGFVNYVGIDIDDDDDSFSFAMDCCFDVPSANIIDLYVEVVDLNARVNPNLEFLSLSGSCMSMPLTQHIPEYNEPLQKQEFSGHINETCHISPSHVASPPQPFQRHEHGGTSNEGNQFFQGVPVADVAYFVRGGKNEKRNEPLTESESNSEDDMECGRDDDSSSEDGDGQNDAARANYRIPSFYTQINVGAIAPPLSIVSPAEYASIASYFGYSSDALPPWIIPSSASPRTPADCRISPTFSPVPSMGDMRTDTWISSSSQLISSSGIGIASPTPTEGLTQLYTEGVTDVVHVGRGRGRGRGRGTGRGRGRGRGTDRGAGLEVDVDAEPLVELPLAPLGRPQRKKKKPNCGTH